MASLEITTLTDEVGTIIELNNISVVQTQDITSPDLFNYLLKIDDKTLRFTVQADRDAVHTAITTALTPTPV